MSIYISGQRTKKSMYRIPVSTRTIITRPTGERRCISPPMNSFTIRLYDLARRQHNRFLVVWRKVYMSYLPCLDTDHDRRYRSGGKLDPVRRRLDVPAERRMLERAEREVGVGPCPAIRQQGRQDCTPTVRRGLDSASMTEWRQGDAPSEPSHTAAGTTKNRRSLPFDQNANTRHRTMASPRFVYPGTCYLSHRYAERTAARTIYAYRMSSTTKSRVAAVPCAL